VDSIEGFSIMEKWKRLPLANLRRRFVRGDELKRDTFSRIVPGIPSSRFFVEGYFANYDDASGQWISR
jgi:hypothetical protein